MSLDQAQSLYIIHTTNMLRLQVPELHPAAALHMNLNDQLANGQITSEHYLKWVGGMMHSAGVPLFGSN